ncbi:MAG: MmcQ/YjbR family DNA-binding protein [Verrucomicrobiales bacterium]|nr:MmcQ/YjbR family DNA-binding protein [Verrucomicrobiales bacterium]
MALLKARDSVCYRTQQPRVHHDTTKEHQQRIQACTWEGLFAYPEAEQAIACKGTSLECTAFKARTKTFLFVSDAEIKLKLGPSLAEATRLASKEPSRYQAGSVGWVTVKIGHDEPPLELLEKWIDESYRLLAHRQLVALLPERGLRARDSTKAAQMPSAKKSR